MSHVSCISLHDDMYNWTQDTGIVLVGNTPGQVVEVFVHYILSILKNLLSTMYIYYFPANLATININAILL